MNITELIRKKREGQTHSEAELKFLIDGYLAGSVRDYHVAAWLMAVFFKGLTPEETLTWTRLMWKSGSTLPRPDRETSGDFWIDKHSTGGIGDKPSLILVPWVTAVCERLYGSGKVRIPMIAGRGLGHTGGTIDKLEAVPGFSPVLPVDKASSLIREQGFFLMGQTADIAPADRLLYALRDVTATVESLPLIVSSILSKKLSENPDGLVFDVKTGSGAFMAKIDDARALAKALCEVARGQGVAAKALITRMDEPLGYTAGNALEMEECVAYLRDGIREAGLHEVTLGCAVAMVELAGRGKISSRQAREACEAELKTKRPFELYVQMLKKQGGDWAAFDGARPGQKGLLKTLIKAPKAGYLAGLEPRTLGVLIVALGGGRSSKEASIDFEVGIRFLKKVGDAVGASEAYAEVYHRKPEEQAVIESAFTRAASFTSTMPQTSSWILEECE